MVFVRSQWTTCSLASLEAFSSPVRSLRSVYDRQGTRRRCPAAHGAPSSQSLQQQLYQSLLEKARACTYDAPTGQLQGRAGRRCILEDGERMLLRCIRLQPQAAPPYLLLLANLGLQGRQGQGG
ncbi:hypothetical protein WJX84_007839 [Apatococcus fuscideae]|uniref:Uncharacterized protein n=1 Tax=Apatococcus fuscideae TaxID=2026836 RepID=A0AAW1SV37_9CHLO